MAGNSDTCDTNLKAARLIQEAVQLLLNDQTPKHSNLADTAATAEHHASEGHTGQMTSFSSQLRRSESHQLPNSSNFPQISTSRSDFVQANLSRLFQPYRQPTARRATQSRRLYETPWTHYFFCLADPKADVAPLPDERSVLQNAGLGKRKITFPNNNSSSYTEFCEQLCNAYPLLREAGGFKIMRCGRSRTLTQIPVPNAGYSVKFLRCESSLNKALAYILPLQQTLYIEPEETEAKEEVAVEICRLCHKHVAVHKLEEHVNSCSGASSTVVDLTEDKDKDSSGSLSETEQHDLETTAEDCDTCPQATSLQAAQSPNEAGPSTGCLYTPLSDILLDSDSEEDVEMLSSPARTYSPAHDEDDIAEVLSNFRSENITQESSTTVVVRRKRVLQSAITALGKTYFAWHKRPQVEFVGELAEDHGGPTREFFRLLMKEVQSSLGVFEGQEGNLYFTYDQSALEQGKYYTAGKLTAWSLLHGGPGLKGLDPALYLLMCGQDADLEQFRCELLLDREVQKNVLKIKQCNTEEDCVNLKHDLGEWIAECGVPQIYNANLESLPHIYGQVVKHQIFHRTSNMISQFKQGVNSCGQLWETVERHWNAFKTVFIHTTGQLTRVQFRMLFKVVWSEDGSNRREAEEETMFSWECLLTSIEEKRGPLSFEDLLAFVTGADMVPPLGFPQQPEIQFYDQESESKRFPYASTCSVVLYLPRGTSSEDDLLELLIEAVHGSAGFGKI